LPEAPELPPELLQLETAPILRTNCQRVDDVTEEVAKEFLETLVAIRSVLDRMPAQRIKSLSAIQIGIPKRVAIIQERDKPELCLIEPQMSDGEGFQFEIEGCWSFQKGTMGQYVPRARSLSLEWLTPGGEGEEPLVPIKASFDIEADGIITFKIQHVLDHLAGVLIPDYGKQVVTGDHQARNHLASIAYHEEMERRRTPVRSVKIGRNDPCICSSGKKFKVCCGS